MEETLYRKYRPKKLEHVVGQDHIKQYFKNAVDAGKISHAYLFSGKRGTGKTTLARIVSLIVNCQNGPSLDYDLLNDKICKSISEGSCPDVHEMDAASNTSIDDIRNIRKIAKTSPMMCRKRVFIIDEVHRLSGAAVSSLLKILEEPPESSMFILATTEIHKILPAIKSRCHKFELTDIPVKDMVTRLGLIARNEKAEIIKKSALEYIAKKSNGSMRDAVTGLDIVLQTGNGKVTMEYVDIVSGGEIDRYDFCDLVDYIFQSDYRKALSVVKKKMSQGITGENLFNDILEYSHDFLLSKSINSTKFLSLSDDLDNRWNEILNKYKLEDFLILNSKIIDYSNAMWQSTRPDLLVDSCLIDTIKTCEKTS